MVHRANDSGGGLGLPLRSGLPIFSRERHWGERHASVTGAAKPSDITPAITYHKRLLLYLYAQTPAVVVVDLVFALYLCRSKEQRTGFIVLAL